MECCKESTSSQPQNVIENGEKAKLRVESENIEKDSSQQMSTIIPTFFAKCLGRYPLCFILATLAITCAACFTLPHIKTQNDLTKGPEDGRSRNEWRVYNEFFKNEGRMHGVIVRIRGANNANLFDPKYLKESYRLLNYVRDNLTLADGFAFRSACNTRCQLNYEFDAFMTLHPMQQNSLRKFNHTSSMFELSYPRSRVVSEHVMMVSNFFDVTVNQSFAANKDQMPTNIERIGIINLWFMFDATDANQAKLTEWEHLVETRLSASNFSSLLNVTVFGQSTGYEDVFTAGTQCWPYVLGGMGAMFVFIAITTLYNAKCTTSSSFLRWTIVSLAVVFSPLAATIVAVAAFVVLGMELNYIMAITPVLVLAIGVDDAFLLQHSWLMTSNMALTSTQQTAATLKRVGPSMCITSITNGLAFAIGYFTSSLPFVKYFCLITSIAVLVDLVFEFTLFTATMALLCSNNTKSKAKQMNIEKSHHAKRSVVMSDGTCVKVFSLPPTSDSPTFDSPVIRQSKMFAIPTVPSMPSPGSSDSDDIAESSTQTSLATTETLIDETSTTASLVSDKLTDFEQEKITKTVRKRSAVKSRTHKYAALITSWPVC